MNTRTETEGPSSGPDHCAFHHPSQRNISAPSPYTKLFVALKPRKLELFSRWRQNPEFILTEAEESHHRCSLNLEGINFTRPFRRPSLQQWSTRDQLADEQPSLELTRFNAAASNARRPHLSLRQPGRLVSGPKPQLGASPASARPAAWPSPDKRSTPCKPSPRRLVSDNTSRKLSTATRPWTQRARQSPRSATARISSLPLKNSIHSGGSRTQQQFHRILSSSGSTVSSSSLFLQRPLAILHAAQDSLTETGSSGSPQLRLSDSIVEKIPSPIIPFLASTDRENSASGVVYEDDSGSSRSASLPDARLWRKRRARSRSSDRTGSPQAAAHDNPEAPLCPIPPDRLEQSSKSSCSSSGPLSSSLQDHSEASEPSDPSDSGSVEEEWDRPASPDEAAPAHSSASRNDPDSSDVVPSAEANSESSSALTRQVSHPTRGEQSRSDTETDDPSEEGPDTEPVVAKKSALELSSHTFKIPPLISSKSDVTEVAGDQPQMLSWRSPPGVAKQMAHDLTKRPFLELQTTAQTEVEKPQSQNPAETFPRNMTDPSQPGGMTWAAQPSDSDQNILEPANPSAPSGEWSVERIDDSSMLPRRTWSFTDTNETVESFPDAGEEPARSDSVPPANYTSDNISSSRSSANSSSASEARHQLAPLSSLEDGQLRRPSSAESLQDSQLASPSSAESLEDHHLTAPSSLEDRHLAHPSSLSSTESLRDSQLASPSSAESRESSTTKHETSAAPASSASSSPSLASLEEVVPQTSSSFGTFSGSSAPKAHESSDSSDNVLTAEDEAQSEKSQRSKTSERPTGTVYPNISKNFDFSKGTQSLLNLVVEVEPTLIGDKPTEFRRVGTAHGSPAKELSISEIQHPAALKSLETSMENPRENHMSGANRRESGKVGTSHRNTMEELILSDDEQEFRNVGTSKNDPIEEGMVSENSLETRSVGALMEARGDSPRSRKDLDEEEEEEELTIVDDEKHSVGSANDQPIGELMVSDDEKQQSRNVGTPTRSLEKERMVSVSPPETQIADNLVQEGEDLPRPRRDPNEELMVSDDERQHFRNVGTSKRNPIQEKMVYVCPPETSSTGSLMGEGEDQPRPRKDLKGELMISDDERQQFRSVGTLKENPMKVRMVSVTPPGTQSVGTSMEGGEDLPRVHDLNQEPIESVREIPQSRNVGTMKRNSVKNLSIAESQHPASQESMGTSVENRRESAVCVSPPETESVGTSMEPGEDLPRPGRELMISDDEVSQEVSQFRNVGTSKTNPKGEKAVCVSPPETESVGTSMEAGEDLPRPRRDHKEELMVSEDEFPQSQNVGTSKTSPRGERMVFVGPSGARNVGTSMKAGEDLPRPGRELMISDDEVSQVRNVGTSRRNLKGDKAVSVGPPENESVGTSMEPGEDLPQPRREVMVSEDEFPQFRNVGTSRRNLKGDKAVCVGPPENESVGTSMEPGDDLPRPRREVMDSEDEFPQSQDVGTSKRKPLDELMVSAHEVPQSRSVGTSKENLMREKMASTGQPQSQGVGTSMEDRKVELSFSISQRPAYPMEKRMLSMLSQDLSRTEGGAFLDGRQALESPEVLDVERSDLDVGRGRVLEEGSMWIVADEESEQERPAVVHVAVSVGEASEGTARFCEMRQFIGEAPELSFGQNWVGSSTEQPRRRWREAITECVCRRRKKVGGAKVGGKRIHHRRAVVAKLTTTQTTSLTVTTNRAGLVAI